MANRTSDLAGRVDPAQSFDIEALLRYASANVHGFPSNISNFTLSQFGHGQSNPTFLIEARSGTFAKKYVLRKKPHGKLLASAHAVEREYEVLHALGTHTQVPVPKVFCLCTDSSVIGTPFYIMEYLEGRIFIDPNLPDVSPKRRRDICRAVSQALASVHSANVDAIGLGNYGKRKDYCKRQVERWAKQYLLSTGEGKSRRNPKMLELVDWLRQHIPLEDSLGETAGLVHGDFRIDNVVFHPTESYFVNISLEDLDGSDGFERSSFPEGIPSLPEYLADYCSAAGNASGGERARFAGEKADSFIKTAWLFIQRKSVLPLHPPSETTREDNIGIFGSESQIQVTPTSGKFVPSEKVQDLRDKLIKFMEDHIYPKESDFYKLAQSTMRWTIHPDEEKLKDLAKREGLWNLWIPFDSAARAREVIFGSGNDSLVENKFNRLLGAGLSNLEYGYLCEIMGRSICAPQIFNCGAPDTGNMEVLLRYGNEEQIKEWLVPLLEGKTRSGFAMTEPQVASSDATNIECSIKRHGDSYIINGKKWWTSGAMDPRCKLLIVMGKTDLTAPKHKQQSMILVDINTPGIMIKRPLTVFGFDDAPHGHAEIFFENVSVPANNILLGEGRGFEIAQGRLGPGRLHHCMRLIGAAERGMQMMVQRALERRAFGKLIAEHGAFLSDVAKCRIELEKTRLLVLEAADQLDRLGNKKARATIAMAKVAAPNMALMVLDTAMQVHGAAGVSGDTVLAHLWATARTLRIADGPDEVHLGTIAKTELRKSRL
uniref:Acyl-CoA dehydrogenase family member 11 n=1 Tax=Solanum tuberosum TaxID=4113 RepID=M1C5G9_SOLTU